MQRKNSINVRNEETDVIKILTRYAKNQGSKSPEKLYMVYTRLVYKVLSIESGMRGQYNASQLSIIATIEIMIAQTVIELMENDVPYKTIYQIVKQKLQSFVKLIHVNEIYNTNKELYKINLAS